MQIDAATRRNLELTRALSGGREGSLLAAIDRTVTAAGARLLERRISGPSRDAGVIGERLDSVSVLADDALLREDLRERVAPRARHRPGAVAARARPRRAARSGGDPRRAGRRPGGSPRGWMARPGALAPEELRGFGPLLGLLDAALVAEPPLTLRDGGYIAAGTSARSRRDPAAARRRPRRHRRDAGGVCGEERHFVAEDPPQQRARLLHRDPGDPCRADAGAALVGDCSATARPPPARCASPRRIWPSWKAASSTPMAGADQLEREVFAAPDRRRFSPRRPRCRSSPAVSPPSTSPPPPPTLPAARAGPGPRSPPAAISSSRPAGIRWSNRRCGGRASPSSPTTAT